MNEQIERGLKMIPKKTRRMHPRAQVQSLRRIANLALTKGNTQRAQDALAAMRYLNSEHDLGYPVGR